MDAVITNPKRYSLAIYYSGSDRFEPSIVDPENPPILKLRASVGSFISTEVDALETYPELKVLIPHITTGRLYLFMLLDGFRKDDDTIVVSPGTGHLYYPDKDLPHTVEIIGECVFSRAESFDEAFFSFSIMREFEAARSRIHYVE